MWAIASFLSGRRPFHRIRWRRLQLVTFADVWFVEKCHSCTLPDLNNAQLDQICLISPRRDSQAPLHSTYRFGCLCETISSILVLPAVGSPTYR